MRNPTTHQDTKKKHICFLFYIMLHIPTTISTQPTQTAAPFKVGLILDTNYPIGQIALTSIQMAIADFYAANANSTKHLVVVQRNSSSKVLTAASSALELVTGESVHAILGPDTASEVAFVANLGSKTNIPIILYSVTSQSASPSLSELPPVMHSRYMPLQHWYRNMGGDVSCRFRMLKLEIIEH